MNHLENLVKKPSAKTNNTNKEKSKSLKNNEIVLKKDKK